MAATDPDSGRTEAKRVTQLHLNQDRNLTDVTVRDKSSGKRTVLKTTEHHPFWDTTERRWVDAGQLTPGHRQENLGRDANLQELSVPNSYGELR
ncbi:polymorphic toxin-type HINT domain-containing protein [Micromonospora haikouensis]|uniref:polymorphic toxin-type HINT domain-containing protein n=1 Tax=Micromonospora haikouensis TaxID=686309 RepID=UPI003D89CECC